MERILLNESASLPPRILMVNFALRGGALAAWSKATLRSEITSVRSFRAIELSISSHAAVLVPPAFHRL